MQNPNACLTDVDPDPDPAKKYHLVLAASKEQKIKVANNQPLDIGTNDDAYNELLTQDEIQSHIDKINQLLALERIEECVKAYDIEGLQYALNARHLSLSSPIKTSLISLYLIELEKRLRGGSKGDDGLNFLRREDVENAIALVNSQGAISALRDKSVQKVNLALDNRDIDRLIRALQDPSLGIGELVWPFAGPLYLEELSYVRDGSKCDIRYEGIKKVNFCFYLHF